MSKALAARGVAAALAACGLVTGFVAEHEGWINVGYRDPVNIVTACSGHTKTAVLGKRYTDEQCAELLASDIVEHGLGLNRCVTSDIPLETRAAFTSFAFNVGVQAACKSTAVRKLNAGDITGACNELPKWNRAGGKVLPGLTRRRAEERAMCLKGLMR